MTGERASIFGGEDDLDVSGFAPKPADQPAARPEQVRAVSEAASFHSREPSRASARATTAEAPRREQRRYRTGRNVQLNIKVRPEALQDFYALLDQQDWVQGEAFERALAALRRELAQK